MNKKANHLLLLFFVVLKFILQYFLINPVYDLHRDEYLHLDQANHLAWGYQSVPPFTAFVSSVIKLLGNGVFWVKFFPALFGVLTLVVTWKMIERLNGGIFARVLAATAFIFSVILRLNTLYQPNSADILFWTLFYFCIILFIQAEQNKWLLVLGVITGIGLLNKYNIIFLLIGLAPSVLLSEQRKILLNRYFYFSVCIALLIVLPNIYWQCTNNFPVIHHMKDLSATQLVNNNRIDFIKEQFLFFTGAFYLAPLALLGFWLYPPFKKYRLISWSFLFTISFFIYLKAKGYYALGLYPVLLAFGSVYTEKLLSSGWKQKVRWVLPFLIILVFVPFIKVVFPVMKPEVIREKAAAFESLDLLKWEDGKEHELPQDFADMLGWKELAIKVDAEYGQLDSQKTIVICDNYGEAGAINYYSAFKNIQAVSFNADYINWFPFEKDIRNVILVNEAGGAIPNKFVSHFRQAYHAGRITRSFAREKGTWIYVLKDAGQPVNDILREQIRLVKEHHKGF